MALNRVILIGRLVREPELRILPSGVPVSTFSALVEDNLSAESLAEYDRRWRSVLGREIEVGVRFRQLARRVDDATLAFLIDLANRDGIKRSLFDWHVPLLSALLDGPPLSPPRDW